MTDLSYSTAIAQARQMMKAGQWIQVRRIGESLLARRKNDFGALDLLARAARAQNEWTEAIRLFERCVALAPRSVEPQIELGYALLLSGRFKQSASRFERALKQFPNDRRLILGLAETHEKSGNFDKARRIIEPLVRAGTDDEQILLLLARLELNAGHAEETVRLLSGRTPSPSCPNDWFYFLGRAHERLGQIDQAWEAFCEGNRRTGSQFDLPKEIEFIKGILTWFDQGTMARAARATDRALTPIVLIGRPRSGTTLLQTILGAHPDVTGLGENPWILQIVSSITLLSPGLFPFPKCAGQLNSQHLNSLSRMYVEHVQTAAPKARWVVDKTLYNYKFLGLMHMMFPQARLIYCRRAAIDNCFAIFAEDLRVQPYANNLRNIGITHRLFERLMAHWRETLSDPILEIDYEALVDDQEGQTRRMLEFCGLPWNDACMHFHESKPASGSRDAPASPTLSYAQVRQPIFRSSLNRAAKYEQYLGPLHEGLSEGERVVAEIDQAMTAG